MNKIKIGAKNYIINSVETNEIFEINPKANAYIDYENSSIFIKKASDDFMQENLLHEILHALFENTGIDEELDVERIIKILAPRLHALCKDNPEYYVSNILNKHS
jgi:Zn-dependent peptidase ImmA (M78 family)